MALRKLTLGRGDPGLRGKASFWRRQMIRSRRAKAYNRAWHPEDVLPRPSYGRNLKQEMPDSFKQMLSEVGRSSEGKKALKKYRQFWKIPYPTEIVKKPEGPTKTLVGAGYTTGVYLADGPTKEQSGKNWKIKGRRKIYFDTNGRRIFILSKGSQKNFGKDPRFVGYARETHYVPTPGMEKAGTFKSGKYWVHEHDDEGGRFPKVYKDKAGNFIYAPGTMRIGAWLRR